MRSSSRAEREKSKPQLRSAALRGLISGAIAVVGLVITAFLCIFALGFTAHSRWLFPLAVAFAYTAGTAVFVLSPGRGSKGYNPFGPVVRRSLQPLLRLHAVYVVLVVVAVSLRSTMWALASPWWTTPHGARHTTHLGTAEFFMFFLIVVAEGVRASILLSDAEVSLQLEQTASRKPGAQRVIRPLRPEGEC